MAHTDRAIEIASLFDELVAWARLRGSVTSGNRLVRLSVIHSPGSATVGVRQPQIVVLTVFKAVASRTSALLQFGGRPVRHIRSESASDNCASTGSTQSRSGTSHGQCVATFD